MNLVQQLDSFIDLEFSKKVFLRLSAAALLLIPADGLWIHLRKFPAKTVNLSQAYLETSKQAREPFASYQAVFDKNTLFGAVAANASTPVLKASIAELVKDYRLKGVILTAEPEAIVEDARTQKTVFVKVGQQVGDLTVKEIKDGMMVLSYLGEEIKLEIQ